MEINQTSNNWLKPYRDALKYSQLVLSKVMNVHEKKIARWEQYDLDGGEPNFKNLAIILKTPEQELKNAYKIGFSRKRLSQLEIKTISICQALNNCTAMGLTPKILAEMSVRENEIETAAEEIKTWFMKGDISHLMRCFNRSFVETIPTITDSNNLDLIEQLIGTIAIAATIPHDSTTKKSGGYFDAQNVEQPWPIRLAINASISLPLAKGLSGISASTPAQLEVARAVEIQETKQDNVWSRAHEIVKGISEEFFMDKELCPLLVENEDNRQEKPQYLDFRKYCKKKIDIHIQQTQYDERHYFAYCLQEEPEEVRRLMLELLPSLKIFICSDNNSSLPVLRLDEDSLQGWIASNLSMISVRREQLKQTNKEDSKVGTGNNQSNIEITVNQVTQNTQTVENQELISTLKQILTEIKDSEGDHRLLRNDVNDILNPLQETGEAPKEGKNWLQKAISALKPGTALITLVSKALELWKV